MISPVSERDHFLAVLEKYSNGTATKEEITFVESYYDYIQKQGANELRWSAIEKEAMGEEIKAGLLKALSNEPINDQQSDVVALPGEGAKTISLKWKWPAIAAAILCIVATLLYQFGSNHSL